MKRFYLTLVLACLAFVPRTFAAEAHAWRVFSPDHEQTFAFGTETSRVWTQWGRDRHLALLLSFTNDPYVDQDNPRTYDNFRFDFPSIRLGTDGRTFYYHAPGGRSVPVAVKRPDFLGIDEVKLLPDAGVEVQTPHGYITVLLDIVEAQ
jgi:hypothetical protein